ncbi:MAG: hypothetical protein JW927_21885 [Deltaproteobacteria bacterium]|nr:hypothetical protein [Deltaproteobacteria bacterium]
MKTFLRIIIIFMIVSGFAVPAFAQESGEQNAGAGQRPAGQRGMMGDPAQMQQMLGDRFKETLELSDDEWKVIGPKVTKVLSFSFQQRGNPLRMFGGNRPGMQGMQGGTNPGRKINPGLQANSGDTSMEDLQKVLDSKSSSADEIKRAVNKVREVRQKAEQEKMAAQKELRELLTVRQEAILISAGLLD